ncbi:MAG: carbohydrate ABC transporter permease [Bacillota bacterium]|jgi:multiple sugar transport system permease protein
MAGKRGRSNTWKTVALYCVLAFYVVYVLFPFYWAFQASFRSIYDIFDPSALLIPKRLTLENYVHVLKNTNFVKWFGNSVIVSVCSTVISVLISGVAAYAIARMRFRGSGVLATSVLATYLIPPSVLFIPLLVVVNKLGLTNRISSLIVTYPTFTVPFCTWFLIGFYRSIPIELEEAAMIDGCSRITMLRKVIAPLALPGLIGAGIYCFNLCWMEFMYALTFISSDTAKTLPVGITDIKMGDAFQWGQLMAAGVMTAIPVVVLFIMLQRYFISGLTAGSVKS